MKLVCYGASVTAQKDNGGYFQPLSRGELSNKFDAFEKIAFGASHYEYAGYGFMQDVLDVRPSACIIDWLTPSMKKFSRNKITTLNKALLEINCLPIWVSFLR